MAAVDQHQIQEQVAVMFFSFFYFQKFWNLLEFGYNPLLRKPCLVPLMNP